MSKVVYRKNGGRRRAGYPLLVLCAVLLFGFSLVNIVWPKRTRLCPLDAGSVLPA